jgi:diguanylate cyclase (GGDEF)-like protein
MSTPQALAFVSYLGAVVQLFGVLMVVGLFAMLRRFVLRRGYFRIWTLAWEAIAIALLAVLLQQQLVPGRPLRGAGPDAALVDALRLALPAIYQCAKLLAYLLLVAGTLMYATGRDVACRLRWAAVGAAVYALASALFAERGLSDMVRWQSPVAVVALSACAWLLLRLPQSRRTVGSVMTAVGFAATALLWAVYALAFQRMRDLDPALVEILRPIRSYNTYLDLCCNMLLGYAMVVVLMEDAKREVDDAQAELRLAHDQLRRASLYDSLTGALNRRAFTEGVGLDLAGGTYGSVVLFDVDNLKAVNDGHGHAAGDALLRRLVDVLRLGLRAQDKLYRWGGDEFLLIAPGARAEVARARVDAILAEAEPVRVGAALEPVRLEASYGAVDYHGAESLLPAVDAADVAMYAEKQRRRVGRAPARLPIVAAPEVPVAAPEPTELVGD